MEIESRVARRYDLADEEGRLWAPGLGDLVRLRTWDIFARFLPSNGEIADVGGGPGAHAAHLAELGYRVALIDPVEKHVQLAKGRARVSPEWTFEAQLGEARELPFDDERFDVVLLMGPMYHLVDAPDRLIALREARRVLRPGGMILAEVMSRFAFVMDASSKDRLDQPEVFDDFHVNIDSGLSKNPATFTEGGFWGYLHRPEEVHAEVGNSGFGDVRLVAVEGFAWLLGDLEQRMRSPQALLRALQLTETEPSMIGCSAHIMAVGVK